MAESNRYQALVNKIKQEGRKVTEESLTKDKDWIESSKKVYRMDYGKDFQGTDQEAVEFGLERMGKFNYNISGTHIPLKHSKGGTIPDIANLQSQDIETKIAFAYLMDTYDDKDPTMAGFGRFIKEFPQDITTYAGFGAGKAIGTAGVQATKQALKRTLLEEIKQFVAKPAVRTTASASAGGAVYGGGFNLAQQDVKVGAGVQPKINTKEATTIGAVGATLGGTMAHALPAVTKGIKRAGEKLGKGIDYLNKQGEEAMAQVAGGGTPPSEYRGYHKAPMITGANTGDNLADIFPDDIYSNKAVQYYGTGDKKMDTKSIQIIQSMRNNPGKEVTIYRAVPKGVKDINDGDWITINPDYAKWHGESWVENGEYDIISKKVKASQISTNGDSIHEWGYNEGATK